MTRRDNEEVIVLIPRINIFHCYPRLYPKLSRFSLAARHTEGRNNGIDNQHHS